MNRLTYSSIRPRGERPLGRGLALASLALLGSAPPAVAAPPGTFQPVGPMVVGRYGATLTLLADGRVLVAGGESVRQADGLVHAART